MGRRMLVHPGRVPRRTPWLAPWIVLILVCGPACTRPHAAIDPSVRDVPVRGGVLRLMQEMPASLDPLEAGSVYEALPVSQIYDGLVTRDAALHLAPALASDWTVSRDGLTYEFVLREGLRFHDGSPVTAEDVVFTYRRALDPDDRHGGLVRSYLTVLEGAREFLDRRGGDLPGVEALDGRKVRFRLTRPSPYFLEVLTMDALAVVPRAHVENNGSDVLRTRPVGTGPFRLAHQDGSGMVLVANEDYFRGRPHLDAVQLFFQRGVGHDAAVLRFLAGSLDVVEPTADSLHRMQADPEIELYRYQELSLSFLGMNTRWPPLHRVEVRQAIAHAIRREALVADSTTTRRQAVGIVPPGMTGFSPNEKALRWDPSRARSLLAQAGYGSDRPVPSIPLLITSPTASATRTVERIRDDLALVGIPIESTDVSWSELGERLEDGTAPLFLLGWIADLADPLDFLRGSFETEVPGNYFGLSDPEIDRMTGEAALELDPIRRGRLCRRLERRILEQAPIVPLYHSLGIVATRRSVRDLRPGPFGLASMPLECVWLDDAGNNR